MVGMKNCDFLEKEFKLDPVLSKNYPTHYLGSHLDNVRTNTSQTKGAELATGLDHISDHAMMRVYSRIPAETKRSLPYKAN